MLILHQVKLKLIIYYNELEEGWTISNISLYTCNRRKQSHHELDHVLFAMLRFFEVRKVGNDHHVVVLDVLSLGSFLVARDADVHARLVLNFSETGGSYPKRNAKLNKESFDGRMGK